jgi:flavin-dependent thymidylate synthase
MPKFERVKDSWKALRKDLYGNVEPEVTLEAITMPISLHDEEYRNDGSTRTTDTVYWERIEQLPAISAGVSYGSKEKLENDREKALKLNKNLIKMGHHTPLEAIQFNFFVSGISKACGAQISRHRSGQGHVSASRRFQTAGAGFIYPTFDYLDDEYDVKKKLGILASTYSCAYETYDRLRSGKLQYDMKDAPPMHKEDARVVLPVSYATERSWFINARALRDFFRLRLAADSEWEIRRVAWMMYDMVSKLLPTLFEDLMEEKITISLDEYRILVDGKNG